MKRFLKLLGWAAGIAAILFIAGLVILKKTLLIQYPSLPADPEVGQWYEVDFDDALSADGSPWYGLFKKGSEDKVIIEFFGGGVSIDAYTAARGYSVDKAHGFYSDNAGNQSFITRMGINNDEGQNPFKDWTHILLPYSTGDFHCGTGDYPYVGMDGKPHILHHHGYTNYAKLMDRVLPFLENTEAVLVTGYSAGGWATSILADDVISRFPQTRNFTIFVDSSLLYYDKWKEAARDIWQAPLPVTNRIVSDNITLDCLTALHGDHPDAKILFGCSVRDYALSNYQAYMDKGDNSTTTRADGDVFQANLGKMVDGLQKQIPGSGIFIWDDLWEKKEEALTKHTILITGDFFTDRCGNGSVSDWVMDAVGGTVRSHGMELIEKRY